MSPVRPPLRNLLGHADADQPRPGMSRRQLLRTSATVGVGALVAAACGTDAPATTPSASDVPDLEQEIVTALRAAGFAEATPDWTVIIANSEVITGPGQRLQMGVLDETKTPAADRDIEVVIVRSGDLEVVQRVSNPLFYDDGLGVRGVYVFDTELADEGFHHVVVAGEGHVGASTINVKRPENSTVPQPGDVVPALATPTEADPQDLEELCTRTPACSMHGASLDTALEAGKPIVLVVATPLYCQSVICGPVVDVVEDVKAQRASEDTTWIHVEVFSDAGNTPTAIIAGLGLQSEPWTFVIGADGTIADRFEGPVVPTLLHEALDRLA